MTRAVASERLDRRDCACLAAISLIYLAVVGSTLDWHCYWSDEFHTINATALPWGELVQERSAVGHPPLFFLVEKLWIGLFGRTEAGTRSLPMLCGLGSLLLLYGIVRHEANRFYACVSCALLATTSTQLMICQMARSYTLLQLLLTAHLALILSSRRATIGRLALSAIISAAAFYTHGAALVAMFTQLLAAAIAVPARWRFICSGAAGSLAYVPFVLAFPRVDEVERHLSWIPPPAISALFRFPALLQFGRHLQDTPAVLVVIAAASIVLLGIVALRLSDAAAIMALQWFFTWAAAAAAAALGIGIISVERYFAPALVCQAAFMALAIAHVANGRQRLAFGIGGVVAVLAAVSAGLYFSLPPFTPWREMAKLIKGRRTENEVVYVASPQVLASPFAYYYDANVDFLGNYPVSAEESAEGIWVCFREPLGGANARAEVAKYVQTNLSEITHYRFHRGAVVHLQTRRQSAVAPGPAAEGDGPP